MAESAFPAHLAGNRRDFLKYATAAPLGAACLVAAPLASAVHAAGDDRIKVALVGCGGRGTGAAAQALATGRNVVLWAMADTFPDRVESSLRALTEGAAGAYNIEKGGGLGAAIDVAPDRRFVGLDAYRNAIDANVDVVIIAAPPGFRPQQFEYAVRQGKHVFMEKPLATDAAGVRRVLAAAETAQQKNLKIGVGLQRHHDATYQEAIRRIHDGALGRLVTLRCYWNSGPPAKTPMPRGNATELEYQVRNWYFFDWLSGDHIVEQHIHNIDVCNWMKQAHPVRAAGMGGRQVRTGIEYGNIYDHHAVEFTYADGTKMFSYCRQMPGCKNLIAEFAEGTEGTAELGSGKFALQRGDKLLWEPGPRRRGKAVSPYQVEHDVLFKAIVDGLPHNEAENGALSTMTAILGRLATYSGTTIEWDDAFRSTRALTTDAESWSAPPPLEPKPDGSYPIAVPGITSVL